MITPCRKKLVTLLVTLLLRYSLKYLFQCKLLLNSSINQSIQPPGPGESMRHRRGPSTCTTGSRQISTLVGWGLKAQFTSGTTRSFCVQFVFGDILVFQHVLVMHFASSVLCFASYDAKCITSTCWNTKISQNTDWTQKITQDCVDRVPNNNKIRSGCPRGELVL